MVATEDDAGLSTLERIEHLVRERSGLASSAREREHWYLERFLDRANNRCGE